MIDIIVMIFWFIIVLGILVFFHEFGHFLAAKLTGIRVERFSIGFPPRIFGKKIGETDYCLQWVPLGGYCKMAGMVDESLDPEGIKGEPWEFMSKPIPIRMFVLFAGPLMNFILAVVLFGVYANLIGIGELDERPLVAGVTEGLAAEQAGIVPGDMIIAIDDEPVGTWDEMSAIIKARPLETAVLTINREGSIITKQVVIGQQDNPTDEIEGEVGFLGIERGHEGIGIIESARQGFIQTGMLTVPGYGHFKMPPCCFHTFFQACRRGVLSRFEVVLDILEEPGVPYAGPADHRPVQTVAVPHEHSFLR